MPVCGINDEAHDADEFPVKIAESDGILLFLDEEAEIVKRELTLETSLDDLDLFEGFGRFVRLFVRGVDDDGVTREEGFKIHFYLKEPKPLSASERVFDEFYSARRGQPKTWRG
jgi:hypothetical protein